MFIGTKHFHRLDINILNILFTSNPTKIKGNNSDVETNDTQVCQDEKAI